MNVMPQMVGELGQPAVRSGNIQPWGSGQLINPPAAANHGDDIVRAIKALNEAIRRGAQVDWSVTLSVDEVEPNFAGEGAIHPQVTATITRKV